MNIFLHHHWKRFPSPLASTSVGLTCLPHLCPWGVWAPSLLIFFESWWLQRARLYLGNTTSGSADVKDQFFHPLIPSLMALEDTGPYIGCFTCIMFWRTEFQHCRILTLSCCSTWIFNKQCHCSVMLSASGNREYGRTNGSSDYLSIVVTPLLQSASWSLRQYCVGSDASSADTVQALRWWCQQGPKIQKDIQCPAEMAVAAGVNPCMLYK